MKKEKTTFGHKVVFSRARDGRWIADVPELPGVTAFGFTRKEARDAAEVLALKVIVDRMAKEKPSTGGTAGPSGRRDGD